MTNLTAAELKRLHEEATADCGELSPVLYDPQREQAAIELSVALRNAVPQLIEALRDAERMTWLSANLNTDPDGNAAPFIGSVVLRAIVSTQPMGEHTCLRRAIDAAMQEADHA